MDLLLHNLRTIGTHHCDGTVGEEAAQEIERLRAENAALRREAHTWWTAARDAEKRAQRVPLDPLDIEEMWDEVTSMDIDDWHQEFARRIERRHGIGA